jgi:hypothetical protein
MPGILARRLGKADDTWHGVRSVLPIAAAKKYYATWRIAMPAATKRLSMSTVSAPITMCFNRLTKFPIRPGDDFGTCIPGVVVVVRPSTWGVRTLFLENACPVFPGL